MSDSIEGAIQSAIQAELENVNTMQPGKIVSYDPATRRAVVKATLPKRLADGDELAAPETHAVPVQFPSGMGGKAGLTWPLGAGDPVALQYAQRSLEGWLGGDDSAPDDPRAFDMTDAVAVPGLGNFGAANGEDVELHFGAAKLRLRPDGSGVLETAGGSFTITAGGEATYRGNKLRVECPAEFAGDVKIDGTLTLAGKNMNTHKHLDSRSGQTTEPL